MMAKKFQFTCRRGLAAKMIGMSLLLGVLLWIVAQVYETQALQRAFEQHLFEMLDDQAQRDRLDFDSYGKSFSQVALLTVGQQAFHSYFSVPEKRVAAAVVKKWQQAPAWLLSRSAQRVLAAPRCLLIFNPQRQLLEIYCHDQLQLPAALLNPSPLLLQKSEGQTYITLLDGVPHMLSAATTKVAGEELTLLQVLPIDEFLLQNLHVEHQRLMALISYNEERVLVSSDSRLIPPGSFLADLEKDYVVNGRSFHDNGGAEMMIRLSSFLPRSEMAKMKEAFVEISWLQRSLAALVLLLGPIPIILWVSLRIRRLTGRVRQFSRDALHSEQGVEQAGDEICVLDENVSALMTEVLNSQQLIRDEALKEARMQGELQQQQKQLELLLLITDALHVGVLTENHVLKAENKLMNTWAESFGGLEPFRTRAGEPERRTISDLQGAEHVFQLQAMCLNETETVVLVSELTAQLQAESDRELLQAELLQAQKMESVGRLAGGVAHDFNNILMAISGNLQLLKRRVDSDAGLGKYINAIDDSANRAADLTKQLLGFSRKQIIDPRPHDINRAVRDLLSMLKRLIGEDIEIKVALQDSLWPVVIDRTQIEQIIMNLAVNARDAMNGGGILRLETANTSLSADYAQKHLGARPGDYVCLSVSDTGSGMSAEVLEHVFEPFFTTKAQGQGTGLGLSMIYGIVKQNNGNIYVYSEPEEGTIFKIFLPRSQQAICEESLPERLDALPRGVETILLVEDDSGVRSFAVELLSELGYTVLEASDGEEALQLFEKYHGRIHLLLTDVVLPKMNGQRLASELTERSNQLAVVFMSGYTQNAIVDHGVLKEGINFLPKPLSHDQLAQAVRTVLDPQVQ